VVHLAPFDLTILRLHSKLAGKYARVDARLDPATRIQNSQAVRFGWID
jgi:hypothetical protein